MVTKIKKGDGTVSKPIKVPFNADTLHIYETVAKVGMEIAERRQRERIAKEAELNSGADKAAIIQ